MADLKYGDLVEFKDNFVTRKAHKEHPEWYPTIKTIGMVVSSLDVDSDLVLVRWLDGPSSAWWCPKNALTSIKQ